MSEGALNSEVIETVANDFELKGKYNTSEDTRIGIVLLPMGIRACTNSDWKMVLQAKADNDVVVVVDCNIGKKYHSAVHEKLYSSLREELRNEPSIYAMKYLGGSQAVRRATVDNFKYYFTSGSNVGKVTLYIPWVVHGVANSESVREWEAGMLYYADDNNIFMDSYQSPCFNTVRPSFRWLYRKSILVTGPESTGKSTLVKNLSSYFNAPYSTEYGRDLTLTWRHTRESNIMPKDYLSYATGQLRQNEDALASKSGSPICFFDTDIVITEAYLKLQQQLDGTSSEMAKELNKVKKAISLLEYFTRESVDGILITEPTNSYTLDGSRDGTFRGEQEQFYESIKRKYNYLSNKKIPMLSLSLSNGYGERLKQAMEFSEGIRREALNE